MSMRGLAWAFEADLPATQKFVLVAIANYANQDSESWASQGHIAQMCGMSRSTVNRAIADLEAGGWISVQARQHESGADRSSVYVLRLPEEERSSAISDPQGFVYVAIGAGQTKIGITRDVGRRMKSLMQARGHPVELIKAFPVSMRIARLAERTALDTLKEVRVFGEWLMVDPSIAVEEVERAIQMHTGVAEKHTPVSRSDTPGVALRHTIDTIEDTKERYITPLSPPKGKNGRRLSEDWIPSDADREKAKAEGLTEPEIERAATEFRNYWCSRPGQGGVKLDWSRTWHNWILRCADGRRGGRAGMASRTAQPGGSRQSSGDFAEIVARRRGYG